MCVELVGQLPVQVGTKLTTEPVALQQLAEVEHDVPSIITTNQLAHDPLELLLCGDFSFNLTKFTDARQTLDFPSNIAS